MSPGLVPEFQKEDLTKSAELLKCPPSVVDKDHLTILHLSDIHFSSKEYFRFKTVPGHTDAPTLADSLYDALNRNSLLPVDAVIISGDFAFKNTHNELETYARKELEAIRDRLSSHFKNWIVIPGNHDIDWGMEKFTIGIGANLANAYLGKTRDYFEFIYCLVEGSKSCVSADEINLWKRNLDEDLWKSKPIRHYMPSHGSFQLNSGQRIEIHGYNSCLIEGSQWPGIGFVGNGQPTLYEKLTEVEASGQAAIKIAVLHHHVKEVSPMVALPGDNLSDRMAFSLIADSRSLINRLIKDGYSMLLHGHQHQPFISQEILPCYSRDLTKGACHRDYINEKLLIFGAGSVSYKMPGDNAFFVHQIHEDRTVTTWNFSMGAEDTEFHPQNSPCKQSLRGFFSADSVRKRFCFFLDRLEKVDPQHGVVQLPESCEASDRVVGTALHEFLVAFGALRPEGRQWRLNLPDRAPGTEKDVGRSNNFPGRLATLLKLAIEQKIPLFSGDWIPMRSVTEPSVLNLLRWGSLNLARGILESQDIPDSFGLHRRFSKAALSEYSETMPLQAKITIEERRILACVVVRRAPNEKIELLLQNHETWEASLLPAIEVRNGIWPVGKADFRKAVDENIINRWFGSKVSFKVEPSAEVVQKLQISPSKGIWSHYHFKVCFLSFDAQARKKLEQMTDADSSSGALGLKFVSFEDIKEEWKRLEQLPDDSFEWLARPLSRAGVANRMLIDLILNTVGKDFNYFYDAM